MPDALYRSVLRPLVAALTRDDAEVAHDWLLAALGALQRRSWLLAMVDRQTATSDPRLEQALLGGLAFPNPFGIAAGLDKNAAVHHALAALVGPGFVELGGVTQRPQAGNPRPRVTRVGRAGLINSMGFPNDGAAAVAGRLAMPPGPRVPLGMNLAKMRDTPDADAPQDYADLVRAFRAVRRSHGVPHFYVVNVSSPNTPGLTALQDVGALAAILEAVTEELDAESDHAPRPRERLLVKLSPDLAESDVEAIVELVLRYDIGGLVETNTTRSRPVPHRHSERPGGFSGSALYDRSARLVRFTARLLPRHKVLVATGGIDTVDRAYEMLQYADLVAGYTGLVLKGLGLFRRFQEGVLARMDAAGVKRLSELREGQRPA